MDILTFTDVVRLRKVVDSEKSRIRIDAIKQQILISNDEIEELSEMVKKAIVPGMKKEDVKPRIVHIYKNYFQSLIQQSE